MSKLSCLIVVGVVLSAAATVRADPNMPRRARRLRVELVRAYAACAQPNQGLIDNSAITACGPVKPLSSFNFGRQGHGRVQIQIGGTLGNFLRLDVALRDVRDAAGKPVDRGSFTLHYSFRISTDFCPSGECTTTQITKAYPSASCSNGRCVGTGVVDLGGFLTPGFDASIEIEQIQVFDSNGTLFAVQGIGRNASE